MTRLLQVLFVAVALVGAAAPAAHAAELIMVRMAACPYCEAFEREVEPTYASTPEGKRAPLRRVHVRGPWPADLAAVRPARQTPYFILVENGHEIGRFGGYDTPEEFWADLDVLLKQL